MFKFILEILKEIINRVYRVYMGILSILLRTKSYILKLTRYHLRVLLAHMIVLEKWFHISSICSHYCKLYNFILEILNNLQDISCTLFGISKIKLNINF